MTSRAPEYKNIPVLLQNNCVWVLFIFYHSIYGNKQPLTPDCESLLVHSKIHIKHHANSYKWAPFPEDLNVVCMFK